MNMNMKKTCKDCTERKVGCHGTCEYYIKRSKKAEEQRNKRYISFEASYNPQQYQRSSQRLLKNLNYKM